MRKQKWADNHKISLLFSEYTKPSNKEEIGLILTTKAFMQGLTWGSPH